MKWICQLVNGRMLAMTGEDTFQVIQTGYPYPDTAQPSADMFYDLMVFLGIPREKREKYDLQKLQFVLRGVEPNTDIPKEELRQLLTGEKPSAPECYASIFFSSKGYCIYAIFNMQLLKDKYMRRFFAGSLDNITKYDVFFLVHPKSDKIEKICKMVPRESLKDFKLFDDCIRARNSLGWGTIEIEKLYSYFRPVNIETYKLRADRNLLNVYTPCFFEFLSNIFGLTNDIYSRNFDILDEVCTELYGKNFFENSEILERTEPTKDDFDLFLFWSAYKLNISKEMNKKLVSAIKSYLSGLSLLYGFKGGFIGGYKITDDNLVLACKEDFLAIADDGVIGSPYKKEVSFIVDNFKLLDIKWGKQKRINLGGMLGSNFTSYEKRLFQFLVVYDSIDKDRFTEDYTLPCVKYKDWVLRFMSCLYDNFKRRFLFGEFGTNSIKDLVFNYFSIKDDAENLSVYVPELFKDLQLDDFNGRQLSEDEIVFLLSFLYFLISTKRMVAIENGVYEVAYIKYYFYRSDVPEVVGNLSIDVSLRSVLRTFMKMKLIVDSYKVFICTDLGYCHYLGDYLFKERCIDKLSDKDFKIKSGKKGIQLTLQLRR